MDVQRREEGFLYHKELLQMRQLKLTACNQHVTSNEQAVHTGRLWLSISTHISTLVLGLSTLALPVDCSGDFGPRGLSVQYTQDVRGCPSAHTGRPWVSVSTHRTSVAVRVCPSAHTGRPWLSISTHISTLVLGLSMLTLPVDGSGDFGPRWLPVQYTQDVRGCRPANTGRPWLSVCVRVCPSVSVSTHRTSVAVHQYTYQHVVHTGRQWVSASIHRTSVAVRGCPTHISTLVLGLNTLALPVDCLGDFGPRGLSVQYTQDIRGCLWLSVSTQRTSVAVYVCPCVSVSTHRTSVAVRVCPSAHTGSLWLSISTHIRTLVLGLSTLALPMDCLGDFGLRGLSVQYTQDVRGCPPANTGRLWLSVAVRQHTQDVCGCPCVSVCAHQHTQDVCGLHTGRPWVSASPHRMSVAVRQHTQDVRGCSFVFVCVCVCPPVHTGRPWLSISTHINTLVLGLSMLALPVDCSGDYGPRGLSVQYTQNVHGCPPAHTGRPWLSEAVRQHTQDIRGCPCVSVCVRQHTQDVCGCLSAHTGRLCVSVSTHRTYVAVRVCPSAHTGSLWLSISTHISTLVLGLSTLALPMDCLGDFSPRGLSVQYAQDVRGCLPTNTGRPWLSVAVRQHTKDVCGCPTLVLGLSTLALPVDCLGDFGPRGLSVQYTQDVHGCPPAHTGRLWLSVAVRQHTQNIHGCPCVFVCVRVCLSVHIGRPWLSFSTYINTLVLGLSMLTLPVDGSGDFGPRGLPVQYTQDVRGCRPANTGRPWLSMCVRVCPSVSVSTHRTSVAVHQYTYQHVGRWTQHAGPSRGLFGTHISTLVLGLNTLALPMDCLGDFGPRGLSVQYTQDIRGCLWLSVSTQRTSVAVCVCPCVSVSTHRTSVAVRVCPSAHTGSLWLSISTHISTLVLGLSTLALPMDCLGDFGLRGLSVQYTQDVRGCPPANTGRPWLSVAVRQHTQDVCGCPCVSVCAHQHTQDVCGCPSVHISARWRSERCFRRTDLANDTCLWGPKLLLRDGNRVAGACVASSPDSNLEAFSHNPAHGRADIEGSKSNVAMNAWLPQASYPCCNFSDNSSFKFQRSKGSTGHAFTMCRPSQTPHLKMSSARIDPLKRV
ncbi:hypothetical protein YC2023_108538 [Brassica napus]